jgi:hypothetical protein
VLRGRAEIRPWVVRQRDRRGALAASRGANLDDVRRPARLGDADDQRPIEPRLDAVDRHDRRGRERDRQAEADPEQVLGVDRSVIARAARGDDDMVDGAVTDQRRDAVGDRLDRGSSRAEKPGGDRRLLGDLGDEAHRVAAARSRTRPWPPG